MNVQEAPLERYYALLAALFLAAALVAWLLAQVVREPSQQPIVTDDTLTALQDDPSDDPKEITGRFCLELSPEAVNAARVRVDLVQIRQMAVVLAARSRAEALRLAAMIDPIDERDGGARALLATHFARLAFAEGDHATAEADARAALLVDDGSFCFIADAHYVLGLIASERGDDDAALVAQIAAVERFPDHIPALLEIARLGLAAATRGPATEAAGLALLALGEMRGARIYAQSLLREVERTGCRTGECHYLRAVLENWLGLPGAALASIDALERRCAAITSAECLVGSAASFRPRLASNLAEAGTEP